MKVAYQDDDYELTEDDILDVVHLYFLRWHGLIEEVNSTPDYD